MRAGEEGERERERERDRLERKREGVRDGGEGEMERDRERDRRRLKGPDYCISSRIQLVPRKSPVRSPYCWSTITEMKS